MPDSYNLVYREEEREMMPFCANDGIAVIPWSPMARGYLAGTGLGEKASTVRGRTDPFDDVTLGLGSRQDEAIWRTCLVEEQAEKLGTKPAVVALAWVAVEDHRDLSDHRRLKAAPPRRRGRGDRTQARRPHNRQTRGALSIEGDRGACMSRNCDPRRSRSNDEMYGVTSANDCGSGFPVRPPVCREMTPRRPI